VLLRQRAGLVRLGTQLQNRIHAVVADFGYDRARAPSGVANAIGHGELLANHGQTRARRNLDPSQVSG